MKVPGGRDRAVWGTNGYIAKQWILETTDKTVVETACERTEYMYEKYKYDN